MALKVIASSTQLFVILEKFVIQKLIEKLGIHPNFKKQNEDYRLTFDMNFWFLHFAVHFSIYQTQNLIFSKFSSKSRIILCHFTANSNKNSLLHHFDILWSIIKLKDDSLFFCHYFCHFCLFFGTEKMPFLKSKCQK